MAANIPGATNALPGVFTDVITESRGASIPGGTRITAIIGEGSTDQTLVSSASGSGKDGFNPTYTSTSGSDGRHFLITSAPLVSNRTTVFKNGVALVGKESTIDSSAFSTYYDYRLDITTGKIELQSAHLVDQGGTNYKPLTTNVGIGVLNSLTLVDVNAPPETWTIRCVSVQRSALNAPIAGTAKFLAFGSISGAKRDANGNPIVWTANNTVVSNGVLSFAIQETSVLSVVTSVFREGDSFNIQVASNVLNKGDSLTANFIPSANLNDPVLVQGLGDAASRHGMPSLDNNLSLGCQLAFANAAPSLVTVQAAPSMPRRTSIVLSPSVNSLSTNDDDFIFPLPFGMTPDFESSIHFFTTNNSTNVETQILPNKFDYYLLDTAGQPTTTAFINSAVDVPAGYSYSYTVVEGLATIASGEDGYIARDPSALNKGIFSSSIAFDATYVGKRLKIIDSTNSANDGYYVVTSVVDGKLLYTVDSFTDLTNEMGIAFELMHVDTGLPVLAATDGYDGYATDGDIVSLLGTGTGYFGSSIVTGVDFNNFPNLLTYRLQINGSSSGNDGLYDITSYNSGTNELTIAKAVVSESDLRYEVIDTTEVSNYVVINKNVVLNGYGLRVTLIDFKDASYYDAGWVTALESLESIECDIVVPLPKQTISVIFQNTLSHCKSMSNIRNKKERVLFCGAISGLTPANVLGTTDAAVEDIGILEGIQGETVTDILAGNIEDLANYSVVSAFGNTFRCVYFYPDQIIVQAGTENAIVDGFYVAAAAAGYLSADVRIQNPLTNKVLGGFTINRSRQFSNTILENLAAAGICVLQPVTGGGRVVWGLTTTQSGYAEEQEISVVFIRDRIAKTLRSGFAAFIGEPESANTSAILNTRATIILNSLINQGLITAYRDLAVSRDTVNPTQWNIAVRCQPTYPVNFIYIKVNLGQF